MAGNAADESHSDALNAPIDAESAEDAAAMQDAAEMQDATEEASGLKTQEQQTEGTEGELQSDLLSAEEAHESAGGQKHQQFGGAMQEHTGTQLRHDMTGAVGGNVTETAFAQVQEQVNGTGTRGKRCGHYQADDCGIFQSYNQPYGNDYGDAAKS